VKLGRVSGTVVSTINHPIFDGRRLLIVDMLDADAEPTGDYLICVDAVGSGHGETVLVVDEGNSARQVVGDHSAPIRAVIVGIVDELMVDGRTHPVA
jgi:ethanolamine utilization protein EutN